jgi:hypothetical protein
MRAPVATHLGILFGFVQTEECSLRNNMGAVCIASHGRRWIKFPNHILGGSKVNYTCYDTSPIISNEGLCSASSEKQGRIRLQSFTDAIFGTLVILGSLSDVNLHLVLVSLKGGS